MMSYLCSDYSLSYQLSRNELRFDIKHSCVITSHVLSRWILDTLSYVGRGCPIVFFDTLHRFAQLQLSRQGEGQGT